MKITEKILKHVQDLPESLKEEVLDFVEYLELKKKKPIADKEETDWLDFSLSNAMRGLENEDTPYSLNNLKERLYNIFHVRNICSSRKKGVTDGSF